MCTCEEDALVPCSDCLKNPIRSSYLQVTTVSFISKEISKTDRALADMLCLSCNVGLLYEKEYGSKWVKCIFCGFHKLK